jgi:hypothetical protein
MIKPSIVADLLSTFIYMFLFTGPAFGVPFSAQKLPESVVDADTTRWLDYQAQAGGLAAGLAREGSALDPTPRIFVLDITSQVISLGPRLPETMGNIQAFALSPSGQVLVAASERTTSASSRLAGAESTTYKIVRTSNFNELIEVPLPLTEFSSALFEGPDQAGNIYVSQSFANPNGSMGMRSFAVSTSGGITELTTLTNQMIREVSLAGLIAAIPFPSDDIAGPVIIVDGHNDTRVAAGSIAGTAGIMGVLDSRLLALWISGNTTKTFDLQTATMGNKVLNLSGNKFVSLASGSFAALKYASVMGELTFFNASSEVTPGCAYPRSDPNRMSFGAARGATAGMSVIAYGSRITSSHFYENAPYLVTPNVSEPAANYCTRIAVTPLGRCRNLFETTASGLSKKYDAKVPARCSFRVGLLTAQSQGLSTSLRIKSFIGCKTKDTKRTLTRAPLNLTLATSKLRSVQLTATLPKASRYLDADSRISFAFD